MNQSSKVTTKTSVGVKVGIAVAVVAGLGLLGYAAALLFPKLTGVNENANISNTNTGNVNAAVQDPSRIATLADANVVLGDSGVIDFREIIAAGIAVDAAGNLASLTDAQITLPFTIADLQYAKDHKELLVYFLRPAEFVQPITVQNMEQAFTAKNETGVLANDPAYSNQSWFRVEIDNWSPGWQFVSTGPVANTQGLSVIQVQSAFDLEQNNILAQANLRGTGLRVPSVGELIYVAGLHAMINQQRLFTNFEIPTSDRWQGPYFGEVAIIKANPASADELQWFLDTVQVLHRGQDTQAPLQALLVKRLIGEPGIYIK